MPPHRTYVETHLGGGAVLRHKRPAAESIGIEKDDGVLAWWRARHPGLARYVNSDAAHFLATHPLGPEDLVYCDPPYPRSTRRRPRIYRHDYDENDHVRLLEVLRGLPCMVVVSSYENELYSGALSDWRRMEFPGDSHTGPRTEVAWANFPEPATLHDSRFFGADFRARERFRRRRNGLAARIEHLSPIERHALFQDLADRYAAELRSVAGGAR